MKNRLNLDWKIEWIDERTSYVNSYLEAIDFTPTDEELEMMGKYILWGKDRKTGLNGRQSGLELETRSGTWDSKETESLEGLLETPGFNEASILREGSVPIKAVKEVFSRSEARLRAPDHIRAELEALWRIIDKTELLTSYYDLYHGRRTSPIRESLLKKFDNAELQLLEERSHHLSIYQYLKERHKLVEMRRQQYTLKDFYAPTIMAQTEPSLEGYHPPTFGDEIQVLPFGICYKEKELDRKIFNEKRFPNPKDFSESELEEISRRIWKPNLDATSSQLYFDFRNTNHLYALFSNWSELCASAEILEDRLEEDTTIREFLCVARTYRNLAKLEPIHQDILELKIQKKSNQEIAEIINKKYSKNYKVNYISTLYCKKSLEAIAQAARDHMEVIENLFYPENFKVCKDCGGIFLLNEKNFVRRHRSSDGFSPRCKKCEKILRDGRK